MSVVPTSGDTDLSTSDLFQNNTSMSSPIPQLFSQPRDERHLEIEIVISELKSINQSSLVHHD